jgi:hypothetical protein
MRCASLARFGASRPAARTKRARRDCARVLLFVLTALVPGPVAAAGEEDALWEAFRQPPARLRPFVRWWWNGARVNEAEALRELDALKAAGIGGVEINTIAMPEYVPRSAFAAFPEKPWLSPEWCRVVKAVAEGARRRGITADLIVGSGWPFGGRFLLPHEQTKRVRVVRREIRGPAVFQTTLRELAGASASEAGNVAVAREVLFVRLTDEATPDFDAGSELGGGVVRGPRLRVQVPPGRHVLRVGLVETGFTHVKLGAPGADGPVVDHWNAAAVRRYLDHMSRGLSPALGGRLGEARGGLLRAAFVDSLELDRANWTDDLPAEFSKRRGYALAPYLPFVLDEDDARGETPRAQTVRRARYDFQRTLVELFHERFVRTYVDWAHDNGLLARMQAYGREAHPLEGSLLPDLPEGESWLWSAHDRVVVSPTVVNKYVSSAAHLGGRGPVSFEAMTNAVPVFRETLEDFKLGMDASLLAGVQQPVLHGFNYSPPEAGFPGWVRFGSWLNEQNPWWPHFRRFADYAARLTTVLSRSEPQARVALLGPRADEWARDGLLYQPFPEVLRPWYHYHLWQALQQAGYGSDFVSERIVREARLDGATLRYGSRAYEVLLLMELESLEPETAAAIARFAGSGGKVLLVGRVPDRAPGLKDAGEADRRVRAAMARVATTASVLPSPQPAGPLAADTTRGALPDHARRALLQWALAWLPRVGIAPDVTIDAPHPDLALLHQRDGGREIFFLANTSREQAVGSVAQFPTGGRVPWRWDAETGTRAKVAWRERPDRLDVHLEPLESLLLVYEPQAPLAREETPAPARLRPGGRRPATVAPGPPVLAPPRLRPGRDALPIVAPWQLELRPAAGARFERRLPQLFDLALAAADPPLAAFGGVAVYRAEFEWGDASTTLLDLGTVHGISAVTLNGSPLGVRWYGSHLYDAAGVLVKGRNAITIEVATSLGNLMRHRDDPAAKRWASWFPPIACGLVGPVQLTKPLD